MSRLTDKMLVLGGVLSGILTMVLFATPVSAVTASDWNPGNIIDDDVFFNSGTMSAEDIQAFLNSKMPTCNTYHARSASANDSGPPYTCLRNYLENPTTHQNNGNAGGGGSIPGGWSAATIIKHAANTYNINPKVLIVLLQKEQSLVTDDWPWAIQYRSATGYGCPDTAPCDAEYYGLYNQVMNAASQFKRYANNPGGYRYKANQNNYIQYNPNAGCGGSNVYIANQATAGLYNYTPYQPNASALANLYGSGDSCGAYGNRNFWRMFNDWFGSTLGSAHYTCKNGSNLSGVTTGQKVMRNQISGNADNVSIVIPNNTGSGCVEAHTWTNGLFQSWSQHIGTNSYTFNPADSAVAPIQMSKNITRYFKIDYRYTSSGRVEVHGWDGNLQKWTSHTATNAGPVNPVNSKIIPADTNGDGIGELYLVDFANTSSGMVEVHGWAQGLQKWSLHSTTALPAIDPTKGTVLASDINGDGKDEFTYVKYGDAQSGYVEFHTLAPNLKQWARHVSTNLPSAGYNPTTDDILTADINGNAKDEFFYVKYSGTQSGRLEIHGWSENQSYWVSHTATSSGSY